MLIIRVSIGAFLLTTLLQFYLCYNLYYHFITVLTEYQS
jgi:hypothetical protein